MSRDTYEQMNEQAINDTIDRLLPNGGGTISETRLRSAISVLAQQIASNTRAYELPGIRTSDELADEWRVSRRRAQAFIAHLHERWGIGRKIGNVWCLSAAEVEQYRPAENAGRPKSSSGSCDGVYDNDAEEGTM